MPMSYDVPVSLPPQLLRALPNRYLRPPSLLFMRDNVALRTILLVTTTHVRNSELWLECVLWHPAGEDRASSANPTQTIGFVVRMKRS